MGNIIDGYVIHYSGDGDGMKDEKNSAKVNIITRISNLFQMCFRSAEIFSKKLLVNHITGLTIVQTLWVS
jgi:hypothetical protein